MSPHDPTTLERLANCLQTLAPLLQRLAVTARQQNADASLALNAAERAVAIIEGERPGGVR